MKKMIKENSINVLIRKKSCAKDFESLLNKVESYFQIKKEEIKGVSRKKGIVSLRHLCYYIMRNLGYTLVDIGELFSKNHATILHGIKNIENSKDLITSGRCSQHDIDIIIKAEYLIESIGETRYKQEA